MVSYFWERHLISELFSKVHFIFKSHYIWKRDSRVGSLNRVPSRLDIFLTNKKIDEDLNKKSNFI